ncbi:MAG TPA: hypothetical protein VL588_00380 [Bdellovibrionota bacterium]|jgi:hypothetical protein|nr:hypothetical protein [Bdellovibrionota bacterium]
MKKDYTFQAVVIAALALQSLALTGCFACHSYNCGPIEPSIPGESWEPEQGPTEDPHLPFIAGITPVDAVALCGRLSGAHSAPTSVHARVKLNGREYDRSVEQTYSPNSYRCSEAQPVEGGVGIVSVATLDAHELSAQSGGRAYVGDVVGTGIDPARARTLKVYVDFKPAGAVAALGGLAELQDRKLAGADASPANEPLALLRTSGSADLGR